MTYPSIYPTGVTIYNPEKCWNGYTLLQAGELGAFLIDMNGREVQLWKGLHGFPNKLLPGGYVLGHTGQRNTAFSIQDHIDLIQVDWEGNIVWKFNQYEYIEDPGEKPQWMARVHHDYQREGNPVGYYAPGLEPMIDQGNTLLLTHKDVRNYKISDKLLLDDAIIEVTWDGELIWEWCCHDHFDEYGFSEAARNILYRDPNVRPIRGGMGDWMHINSMSVLGPNKWFDAGDERFHPENIIWSGRETNIIAIIDKKTGNISWKLGPDYDATKEQRELGWIIGPHHPHLIPQSLPGGGNLLVFDNGGWAGYGLPNPSSPTGRMAAHRDYSRVLEIEPTTLKIVWQYTPSEAGLVFPVDSNRFYSPVVSGAQRMPNGNTLITEGSGGRVIEVTPNHEIVWEYINPYWGKQAKTNMVYRAYRSPYAWVPQIEPPKETPIERVNLTRFRVPGAAVDGRLRETAVDGVLPYQVSKAFCVAADDEIDS